MWWGEGWWRRGGRGFGGVLWLAGRLRLGLVGAGSELLFWAVGLVSDGVLGCGLGLEVGGFVPFSLVSSTVAATSFFRGRPRLRFTGADSSSFGVV